MSAQQPARLARVNADPVTPVIIKTGGGGGDPIPPGLNPVKIDSSFMPFVEAEPGLTWASSQSSSRGRINNVLIKDGTELIPVSITPSGELVSVTIKFDSEQLILMESGVPMNDVVMLIASPQVAFHVSELEARSGEWTETHTSFQFQIKSVTLTVGDKVQLHHECKSLDVKVKIDFNLS